VAAAGRRVTRCDGRVVLMVAAEGTTAVGERGAGQRRMRWTRGDDDDELEALVVDKRRCRWQTRVQGLRRRRWVGRGKYDLFLP
jgi:hypothetical protein